jgi:D-arabinose 1-dehydrogenase-like Zn-dependent alcohol dehydrogenase
MPTPLCQTVLKAKQSFFPRGLSGTGSVAVQLVTPVLGARRVVITFVKQQHQEGRWTSSALGTMVQIVDYTKQDVAETIGKGNADSLFDMISE